MPASSIEELRRSIDWSATGVDERVNHLLQQTALQFLGAYQRGGNTVLGAYHDKRDPTEVARQFAYMLGYVKALPEHLPNFYNYLLSYPNKKPANVDDAYYWAKVKFGLKPTLRIVHVLTMRGGPADPVAYAVAEKQLYASHYFETALDLTFCIRGMRRSESPWILSDHDHGVRAGRLDRRQGIDCPEGGGGPVDLKSQGRTHNHQDHAGR